jgi:hypothetical protein
VISRSNHYQLVRENSFKLVAHYIFRLPAYASQCNGPTYGSGAMATLGNISSSKQPNLKAYIQGSVEDSVIINYPSSARTVAESTTVTNLTLRNVFCRRLPGISE